MSTHVFEVEVEVTGWSDPGDGRAEADYAYAAMLEGCHPRDAEHVDGFADLRGVRACATVIEP